ncbi:peptidase, imelysin family protein [Ketobacter sp. MCCC 1A13808]|uniref:imelysin family protein n=1 Tax=Ketobacter sp. MCCC 1A13808 TaxID=2602738 RepID=UPI000F0F4A1A|nr:imelysin family protein [Ketobacter sp. MCCC 1A13808]MVF14751.1 peptidase, imelysin family protein [Ketobacter sp. MCCC 1A13808]RLP55937.1 MAG: peptidase, imelysin family protein [Ketobacter sp.]
MKRTQIATSIALISFLGACGGGGGSTPVTVTPDSDPSGINMTNAAKVLQTNADIALAAYSDAVDTAVTLQTAIATFKADPTQANLDAAKRAWLVAREPYGQTEVYRFRLSPIDSTDYASEDGPEGDINAWPLGEALIDYVTEGTDFGADQVGVTDQSTGVNYPTENIINSSVTINEALISNTATADDEHDVIAGYHAIEFMLWGQDLNLDSSADTETSREMSTSGDVLDSGGHRPLTDFTSDTYAARRFQYLEVVAAKLVADLTGVRDSWADGAAYRSAFTTIATEEDALQKFEEILTGMGTLSEGELAGERMQIAFSSNSQEDEHSCFSDNTHRDVWLNAEGVSNSYFGVYAGYDSTLDGMDDSIGRAIDGYGFDDYLADAGLDSTAATVEAALAESKMNYEAIDRAARVDGNPFDVLIMPVNRNETNPVYKTILSLNAQASTIADLATELGVSANVVDDDASGCDTTQPDSTCD